MSFDPAILMRTVLLLIASAYVLAAAFMYVNQRGYQYFPSRQGLTAAAAGLDGVEDLKLAAGDGTLLQAWYAPARAGKATILFLHGNAGELADRAERFAAYQGQGFGVFFLSYRGYGASAGSPSEEKLVSDATAAYDWLSGRGIGPEKIVIVGESLGTGVAVQLAAARKVAALALEAPFASAANIAASLYWWLPVRLLMKDKFDSFAFMAGIAAPLLVIHGELDEIVPIGEGRDLFALAHEPKQMKVIAGGAHESIASPETWEHEMRFFERYVGLQGTTHRSIPSR